MIRLLLTLMLGLAFPAASLAEPVPARADLWRRGEDRMTFTTALFSFPARAGVALLNGASEFGHAGEGIDNILQYEDPDHQIFATVYIYYPGLAHSGLSALITNDVIHFQSDPDLRELGSRVVAAAGQRDVAIRADYAGFRHGMASSAAFIKAGRWIVKLRVSGPESRRAHVEAAMTSLLDGMRFEGADQPRPAAPLEIRDCGRADEVRPAHLVPWSTVELAALSMIGTMDGAGEEARDGTHGGTTILPPRFRTHWCRAATSEFRVYRIDPSEHEGGMVDGRSLLFHAVNDAGTTLELVETINHHFVLLYHQIGQTIVLGAYDGSPSDRQIADILSGADEPGSRIRATVDIRPGRGPNIHVNQQEPAGAAPST